MRRARGFTLVEILVALTMFAIVGGALLQLFQSGLRTARISTEHTHAIFLARSKLTELQAYNYLEPGTLAGNFADGYRWQAELTPAPESESVGSNRWLQPLALKLTVFWGERDAQRSFELQSLLLSQRTAS